LLDMGDAPAAPPVYVHGGTADGRSRPRPATSARSSAPPRTAP